jgi:hypothetical protein
LVKYNDNPKFVGFTEAFIDVVIPEVRTYCEFIPNVYYISSTNIEGSLIPIEIAKLDPSRKNIIISGDMYDTQYDLIPNFEMHMIHRGAGYAKIAWDIPGFIGIQTNKEKESVLGVSDIFNSNYYFYVSLLSMLGSRIRSVDGISGFGPYSLKKALMDGIKRNKIDEKSSNPELIATIFDDEDLQDEFINNFLCTSYVHMSNNLSKADELTIVNQIIDRSDVNTLQALNRTRFFNHPIKLEWLI